jgi:hypothetical protein
MRLQEFGKGATEEVGGVQGVTDLLTRRYFSRLWVVQELILSPRVIIRIGDVDFQSDGTTSGNLWASELDDLAPWVQHTSRGASLDLDLLQMMQLTFSTGCADPRDRLFGLMGILTGEALTFAPDYSLPVQHVFLGLAAHLLVAKDMGHVLAWASGISESTSIPSWLPDWTSWETWRAVLDPTSFPTVPKNDRFASTISALSALKPRYDPYHEELVTVYLPRRGYRPSASLRHGTTQGDMDPKTTTRPSEEPVLSEQPSHALGEARFTGVDSTTSGLRARMVRLLALDYAPIPIGQPKENGLTVFELRCLYQTVYLSCTRRLDLLVKPGTGYLYLFAATPLSCVPGLCILRHTRDTGTGCNAARLVVICETILFRFNFNRYAPRWGLTTCPSHLSGWKNDRAEIGWPESPVDELDNQATVYMLYWTLYDVIERAQTWLDSNMDPEEQLLFLQMYPTRRRDVLSVYWPFVTKEIGYWEKKEIAYWEKCLAPYFEYMDKHGAEHFYHGRKLTVPFFTIFMDPLYQRLCQSEPWLLRCEGPLGNDPYSEWEYGLSTSGIGDLHFDLRPGEYEATVRVKDENLPPGRYTATVRIKNATVVETLLRCEGRLLLYMVRLAAQMTGESEDQLLARRPTEADRLVRVPTSETARNLLEKCGCDGTVEDVVII